MLVSEILEKKGTEVVAIEYEASCRSLIALLDSYNIGAAVVVSEGERIIGIISERDVVRAIAKHGEVVLGWLVRDLATKALITCSPNDNVAHAMKLMTRKRVRHLVVTDDGSLVGIISIGDIVKHRLKEMEFENRVLRDVAGVTNILTRGVNHSPRAL